MSELLAAGPLPDGVHPASLGYHSDPTRLSPNGAKKLLPPSTPKKFDFDRKHGQKSKRAFDFGTVAHKLVLNEGDQFLVLYPEIHGLNKDGSVSKSPASTDKWKAAAAGAREQGLVPISSDDYLKAVEMAKVVHEHETAGPLLADGVAEQWWYWHDEESQQGLRQRHDWYTQWDGRLTVVEYKTAADASREVFRRKFFDLRYHLAFAFAVTGAWALELDETPAYLVVAQEKEPPYDLCVHEPDSDAFQLGYRHMQQAIATYRRCVEANTWPGYPAGINPLSPPHYALRHDYLTTAEIED